MEKFIKQNWFKAGLLIILVLVIFIYWNKTNTPNTLIPINTTSKLKEATPNNSAKSFDRYIVNNDNTITDTKTGLTWENDYTYKFTAPLLQYDKAVAYCNNLSLAGNTPWHLPTLSELQSIFDSSVSNPATKLPNTEINLYWSSTVYKDSQDKQNPSIEIVSFVNNGYFETPTPKVAFNNVRCVR